MCVRVRVPEPLRLVVHGPGEAPRLAVVHLRHQLRIPGLVGIGGKLDRDGLGAAGRGVPVELLDGILGLGPLVESDEGHAPRQTCTAQRTREPDWPGTAGARAHIRTHIRTYLTPDPPAREN